MKAEGQNFGVGLVIYRVKSCEERNSDENHNKSVNKFRNIQEMRNNRVLKLCEINIKEDLFIHASETFEMTLVSSADRRQLLNLEAVQTARSRSTVSFLAISFCVEIKICYEKEI